MSRLLNFLSKKTSLIFFSSASVFISVIILKLSGSIETLDTRFYYSIPQIYGLLYSLEASGRETYLRVELIDLGFIFSYSAFLFGLSAHLWRRIWKPVFLIGFFDLVETLGIIVLIRQYPAPSTLLAGVVRVATPLKWCSVIWVIALIFYKTLKRTSPS